jgi:hypothetical protein
MLKIIVIVWHRIQFVTEHLSQEKVKTTNYGKVESVFMG